MKAFNLVIAGVGGQGLITLNNIIAEAAFLEGFEVRASELHGLSQRSGSVETHLRFGKKIYSPLVAQGGADLILGLEITEGLRAAKFAGPETVFTVNNNYVSFLENISQKKVEEKIRRVAGKNLHLVSASDICKREFGKDVVGSTYLLGYAIYKKLIPLGENSVIKAIKKIMPKKYQEINIKAFNLAKNYDK